MVMSTSAEREKTVMLKQMLPHYYSNASVTAAVVSSTGNCNSS